MRTIVFEVEQAGCESCAARVHSALEPLGDVDEIIIDEEADSAAVRLVGRAGEDTVNEALAAASEGSGHVYRVRPGSWRDA